LEQTAKILTNSCNLDVLIIH